MTLKKEEVVLLIGISSIAGDRGRKSNYIYSSAKAVLTAYLSGLKNRLYDATGTCADCETWICNH